MDIKSGFIGIIGRPNAGKSTLLNALLGQKVAITTSIAQTTRNTIRGILNESDSQLIFLDTPGIHKPRHSLGESMNKNAYSSASGSDIIYYLFDASQKFGKGDQLLIKNLKRFNDKPVFLLINKIDTLKQEELIDLTEFLRKQYDFKEIIPISALEKFNLENLLTITKNYLHDDIVYYDRLQVTDSTEEFVISEIIREKVLNFTREEVPHSIAVLVEASQKKSELFYLRVLIVVERDSQKQIIIGKGGNMIKKIGTVARQELEDLFECKVFLDIFVKVEKNWRNNLSKLKEFGYHE